MQMLKHGILGLLNYGEMTGYQIMQVFRDSLNYFWTAQTSQIYRELRTLEDGGLVAHEDVKGDRRPDSKLFSITDAGRAELLKWLCSENSIDTRSRLMMMTFFRGELSAEENVLFFKAIKQSAEHFCDGLGRPSEMTELYSGAVDMPGKAVYWKMTVMYGKMYMKMLCEWCDACIEMIREGEE